MRKPVLAAILALSLYASLAAAGGKELNADLHSICPSVSRPVCGEKAGQKRDFGNECLARRDGFVVIREGSCDGSTKAPLFPQG